MQVSAAEVMHEAVQVVQGGRAEVEQLIQAWNPKCPIVERTNLTARCRRGFSNIPVIPAKGVAGN